MKRSVWKSISELFNLVLLVIARADEVDEFYGCSAEGDLGQPSEADGCLDGLVKGHADDIACMDGCCHAAWHDGGTHIALHRLEQHPVARVRERHVGIKSVFFASVDEYLRKVASFGGEDELLVSQGFKIDALAMRQGVVLVEDDNELVGQDLARLEL